MWHSFIVLAAKSGAFTKDIHLFYMIESEDYEKQFQRIRRIRDARCIYAK